MHHPNRNPGPKPPPRQPAAGQGRGRGRRARPGPPGFTIEVQVLGGEAGRRLAREQTEAIAAVLAWLAAHPPPAATGSAATVGKPVGQETAMRAGTRPAPPSPAGAAGASRQRGKGGSGGAPTPKPNGPGQCGGPVGLEVGGWWSTSPAAVRVQAVGLVGAGHPVGEVARALGVHPAAVRRWVWHAWRGWGTAMDPTQPDSPDPPG